MNRWLRCIRIIAFLSLSGASCGIHLTGSGSPDTGLEGRVVAGPQCPVLRDDQPCPDKPFSALFEVFGARDRRVAQFQSNADGHFRVALDPGTYTIVPEASAPLINPRSQRHDATVHTGGMTQVTLVFDTGIR